MIRAMLPDQHLAQEFGFSIDVLWIGQVLFNIRGFFLTVENIVGTVVHEHRPCRCRGYGQIPGSMPVDQECFLFMRLAGVDLRESSGIDDNIRPEFLQRCMTLFHPGDVELRQVSPFRIVDGAERFHQIRSQHPASADD